MLRVLCRRCLQNIIILIARPYVIRELFGWGRLYSFLVGEYQRDWFWAGTPTKIVRGKLHGYMQHLDISAWPDRSNYFLGRWYDLDMQLLMIDLVKPGDTVVDVGAHRGDFALLASRLVAATGSVICFEPNPAMTKILKREISTNQIKNIVVHPVGLGTQHEEFEQDLATNTLYAISSNHNAPQKLIVRVDKGDDLLRNQRPDFIKIDVEGFECNVLAGLSNTIDKHHPIIVTEISPHHLSECGFSVSDLVGLMQRHGYKAYKLGLRKEPKGYTWDATAFDFEANPVLSLCDAIWIHPASNSDRVAIFNKHITNS